MGHPLWQLQRQHLENRAANERQADRLALVLAQPCFVIFDSVTGYNHPVALDQLEQWQEQIDADTARIVYYTFTCSCGAPATQGVSVGTRYQPCCNVCADTLAFTPVNMMRALRAA